MPLPDGAQRGVDHARGEESQASTDDRQQRHQREDPARGLEEHPAYREHPGRHISGDRRHALARQPRCAPLRERPPGPLGPAQMRRGGEQSAGDQGEGEGIAGKAEPSLCGHKTEQAEEREPHEQPKPRTRGRREQDDGVGWMHGVRLPHRRRQPVPLPIMPKTRLRHDGEGGRCGTRGDMRDAGHLRGHDRHHRESTRSTQANRRSAAAPVAPPAGSLCGGGAVPDPAAASAVTSRRGRGGRYLLTGL